MSELDDLWICPACGGRFVTPNMWHSCGEHSLEELFATSTDEALELAVEYVAMLRDLGDVQVIPQKTRLVSGGASIDNSHAAPAAVRRGSDPTLTKSADARPCCW